MMTRFCRRRFLYTAPQKEMWRRRLRLEHYICQNHMTPDPQCIQRGSPGMLKVNRARRVGQ
jgi:hypothetical protein